MSGDEKVIGSKAAAKQEPSGQGTSGKGGGTSLPAPETRERTPRDEEANQGLNPSAPGETGTTPGSNAKSK